MKHHIFLTNIFLIFGILHVSGQDFEVSPVNLDFNTEPGQTQTKSISIKNHSNRKIGFSINITDFQPKSDGSRKILPPNTTKNTLTDFININPTYFELNPNESKSVTVSMQIPSNDFTSRWGLLTVQTAAERTSFKADQNLRTGLVISPRILVYISQSPGSNKSFKIQINNLTEIFSDNDSTRIFKARIENTGEKITECQVYLIAANLKSKEETFFSPISVISYPGLIREVKLELPNTLKKGKYALSAIVDYGSKTTLEGTQILIDVPRKE